VAEPGVSSSVFLTFSRTVFSLIKSLASSSRHSHEVSSSKIVSFKRKAITTRWSWERWLDLEWMGKRDIVGEGGFEMTVTERMLGGVYDEESVIE
jgi:hypothetical protein